MRVTLDWLRDFVDIDVDSRQLADDLVSVGFEIEEIIDESLLMDNVLVGQIKKIEKHPDADRLLVCQVDFAKGELVQIITAADNVFVGAKVPVALDNSILPNGLKIKKGKMRGLDSNGMFCSGEELVIGEDEYKGASVHGILILDDSIKVGEDMKTVLDKNSVIFDISVTSNRPDCNSVLGIAREIAAIYNKPLKLPNLTYKAIDNKIDDKLSVKIEDTNCSRYMAAYVDNIKICPSDKIIQRRLRAVGMRAINNIVDITNYVLVEIGQPMHAFDYNTLDKKIIVRPALPNERIKLLNEQEILLDSDVMLITNGEKALAIAGIMGAEDSGIKDNTNTIIFESAKFKKDNIRETSKRISVTSDAQHRFERGIDFQSQEFGIKRALSLIDHYGYGRIYNQIIDVQNEKGVSKNIKCTIEEINKVIGIDIDINVAKDILTSLSFECSINGNKLDITAPLFRDDIYGVNDIAEEIIRMYGYDKLIPTLISKSSATLGGKNDEQQRLDKLRDLLVNNGYYECYTYSFISPDVYDKLLYPNDSEFRNLIKINNALGYQTSVMRNQMASSMLETVLYNQKIGNKEARLFETAKVFKTDELPINKFADEPLMLAIASYGDGEDFYQLKALVKELANIYGVDFKFIPSNETFLHPGKSADLFIGNIKFGYIGEIHPLVCKNYDLMKLCYLAEINLDLLTKYYKNRYKFKDLPKFPFVERDLAIVVSEDVKAIDILKEVKSAAGAKFNDAKIFDIFKSDEKIGKGLKSVALSFELIQQNEALSEEEISTITNKIIARLEKQLNAKLR